MIKVVHIATTDFGGAAQGMINLHYALVNQGIDSKILVADKTKNNDFTYKIEPNYQLFEWSNNIIVRKLQYSLRKRGKLKTTVEYWNDKIRNVCIPNQKICYTSPFSNYDITKHQLVKDADIIHLHWVGDFLDYPSFFNKIDKPIVWTLRDENPGLGGFHYTSDKEKYGSFYNIIENNFLDVKRQALIQKKKITLIALSDAMKSFCSKVDYLAEKKIYKIYNPIDSSKFKHIDHHVAKHILNINNDTFVISFVSVSLKDHRKGLVQLLAAIKQISKPIKLLCVGINDFFEKEDSDVICFGKIDNYQLLSLIYSASDVFITPSTQESFGKTTIEAMMCGTPVISTKTGIASEIVNDNCGVLIDDTKPQTIINAINLTNKKKYNKNEIIEKAEMLFNPESIAEKHIKLYYSLLNTL